MMTRLVGACADDAHAGHSDDALGLWLESMLAKTDDKGRPTYSLSVLL